MNLYNLIKEYDKIMEEYIDLYDDNKKNTGVVIPRSKEKDLPEGMHILV